MIWTTAIDAARTFIEDAKVTAQTEAEVTTAVNTLKTVINNFNASIKVGTKLDLTALDTTIADATTAKISNVAADANDFGVISSLKDGDKYVLQDTQDAFTAAIDEATDAKTKFESLAGAPEHVAAIAQATQNLKVATELYKSQILTHKELTPEYVNKLNDAIITAEAELAAVDRVTDDAPDTIPRRNAGFYCCQPSS
ncbi:hypothetical protein [Candidatus Epulonipiscium viviparus]|uniref:hypothetical protein n=1 Tax=Candidatus Epulonipiscium viviparus TaxID=420336 RepID=UPI00273805B1|nr:hypothetical protein [Candidatus Epulopiscium viviparus]